MKVTVCEFPDERKAFARVWEEFVVYVREQRSELMLLPELPFSAWFARTPEFDAEVWQRAQSEHDEGMRSLSALSPATVLGTHLVTEEGQHFNRGFCWSPSGGYQGVHDKYYFPNEEDFYERNWFDRNRRDFSLARPGGDLAIGFLICTEVMFNEWARYYGRQGGNIIAVPRASSMNYERWIVAMRMAAIASGAFVISSNRVDEQLFLGRGVIIDPEGEVLAVTSPQEPFITLDIDLQESARAKQAYPRDVWE